MDDYLLSNTGRVGPAKAEAEIFASEVRRRREEVWHLHIDEAKTSLDETTRISRHKKRFISLHCTSCGEEWKHELDCGDRLCSRCNMKRAARIKRRFRPFIEGMKERKFLTLTLKREPLTGEVLSRIVHQFSQLRHRKVWTARGGVFQIEIGTLDDLGLANIHIHAIIDGPFMKQADLSKAWREITGDSFIVDIEQVKSVDDVLDYITKMQDAKDARRALTFLTSHMTKIVPSNDLEAWKHDLINSVLKNRRLVQGFGYLAKVSLKIKDPVCPFCGSVKSIVCLDYEKCYEDYTPVRNWRIARADAMEAIE